MPSPANHIDLNTALPFSRRASEVELQRSAEELLERLDISANIQIMTGNARQGLEHERRFRLSWWMNGEEPLRAALHRAKPRASQSAFAKHKEVLLTDTWKQMERLTSSQRWRKHFRVLTRQSSLDGQVYVQRFFRIAQLFWNRAARRHAAFPTESSSPFTPFIALLACGVVPLGCHNGALWLFVWDKASRSTLDIGPAPPSSRHFTQDYIFFSAPFREAALTETWREAFHAKGWKTLHGPVSEEAPPEFALGKQISEAAAVVGLLREADPDFGLPWWMYQELDCACFFKCPVALISPAKISNVDLSGLRQISDALGTQNAPGDEHEIWQWLNGLAA